jgi:flagellar motor switch protein FliN/FliY
MSQMIESFMNDDSVLAPGARAIELEEFAPAPAGGLLLAAAHPLHGLQVQLQVCIGTGVMTLGDLLAARENQVLALDRTLAEPVDLLLEGKVVARGQLVAVEDAFAVRITELPLPLKL